MTQTTALRPTSRATFKNRLRTAGALVAAVLTATAVLPASPVAATPPPPTLAAPAAAGTVGRSPTGGILAAVGSDFSPGNIISDGIFFDPTGMNVAQTQQFLLARGANCVAGEQPCLKDARVTTVEKESDGLCTGYRGGLVQTAAEVIVGVAQSCGVNPRVLLVLLEKEQSLITRSRPTTYAYERATGFGCPDTAPCNAEYFGLFNQLYLAARQYQNYAQNPDHYPRYRPGRSNTIQYHPNTACGSSSVFIANQATAGLYTYTPYQPNAAALANLYGTGDACSAYGNRNFWRLYTDWFGSTQGGGFLARTPESATVYVLSGSTKHAIGSLALMNDLAPLGPLGYVSAQHLGRFTTGAPMQRAVLDSAGSVYFLDEGKKMPFSTCGQVADYGFSCSSLVGLDLSLGSLLPTGPAMSSVYRTTSGKTFLVQAGEKRESADDASLAAAGYKPGTSILSEDGIAALPYGTPVTRDGIVLQARETGSYLVQSEGLFSALPAALRTGSALSRLPVRQLDAAGVSRLPVAATLGPFVKAPESTSVFFLGTDGDRPVTDPSVLGGTPPTAAPGLLELLPDAAPVPVPFFVKGTDRPTIWNVVRGERRALLAWDDLVSLAGANLSPAFLAMHPDLVGMMPLGPPQLGPASLVAPAGNGSVYLVDGRDRLVPLGSFAAAAELGVGRYRAVPAIDAAYYSTAPGLLSTAVRCGTERYLGLGGTLYPADDAATARYALTFTDLDPLTCASLIRSGNPLGTFLRTANGTIYMVENGEKRPIRSMGVYTSLGGTPANTHQVSDYAARRLPTGPLL